VKVKKPTSTPSTSNNQSIHSKDLKGINTICINSSINPKSIKNIINNFIRSLEKTKHDQRVNEKNIRKCKNLSIPNTVLISIVGGFIKCRTVISNKKIKVNKYCVGFDNDLINTILLVDL
tara:strand:+ start:149 stop:508 length:360 start_codon:yes stop_codon:yes gene_type:complete